VLSLTRGETWGDELRLWAQKEDDMRGIRFWLGLSLVVASTGVAAKAQADQRTCADDADCGPGGACPDGICVYGKAAADARKSEGPQAASTAPPDETPSSVPLRLGGGVKKNDLLPLSPEISARMGYFGLDLLWNYVATGGVHTLLLNPELVVDQGDQSTPFVALGYVMQSASSNGQSATVNGFFINAGYEWKLDPVWLQFGAGFYHQPEAKITDGSGAVLDTIEAFTGFDVEVSARAMIDATSRPRK
jgi:hypothetical protein